MKGRQKGWSHDARTSLKACWQNVYHFWIPQGLKLTLELSLLCSLILSYLLFFIFFVWSKPIRENFCCLQLDESKMLCWEIVQNDHKSPMVLQRLQPDSFQPLDGNSLISLILSFAFCTKVLFLNCGYFFQGIKHKSKTLKLKFKRKHDSQERTF